MNAINPYKWIRRLYLLNNIHSELSGYIAHILSTMVADCEDIHSEEGLLRGYLQITLTIQDGNARRSPPRKTT